LNVWSSKQYFISMQATCAGLDYHSGRL